MQMQIFWQRTVEALETAVNDVQTLLATVIDLNDLITTVEQAAADANAAAAAATAAAGSAEAAADAVTTENNLVNSYVSGTPPVVSADSTGLVTITTHDRVYGDGTSVSVTGGTVASGLAAGAVARVYYDQPSRAGGAVSYSVTIDPAVAAQAGDRHVVGAVEIPAAGTADGNYVQPRGYMEP